MLDAHSQPTSLGRNYRFLRLYWAHFLSLLGNGLTTATIGLVAYELVGDGAAAVVGVSLAIRVFVLVMLAPVAGFVAHQLGEKVTMVVCQFFRGSIVVGFFFSETVFQIYLLSALLACGSSLFVPVHRSLIPAIVGHKAYPRALAYGAMAYEVTSIASPALAAIVIALLGFRENFLIHAATLFISMLLIARLDLGAAAYSRNGLTKRPALLFGLKEMLRRAGLRSSIWLGLRVSVTGSFVHVATVKYVKADLALSDVAYALAMVAYGVGSTLGALIYAKASEFLRHSLLKAMLPTLMLALIVAATSQSYGVLLAAWFMAGSGQSLYIIASNRLLADNSIESERPHLFGAQISLGHAGWAFTYPLAGFLTSHWGFHATAWLFAGLLLLIALLLPLKSEKPGRVENPTGAV